MKKRFYVKKQRNGFFQVNDSGSKNVVVMPSGQEIKFFGVSFGLSNIEAERICKNLNENLKKIL
jgi:hypothetical protein